MYNTSTFLFFSVNIDQDILTELERARMLVFTPSREIGGKRMVCYDDRYILRLASELDGVVVSNDNYRDLANESPAFRSVVQNNILMYSFVNDRYVQVRQLHSRAFFAANINLIRRRLQVYAAGRSAGPFGSYPRRVSPEQSAGRRSDGRQLGDLSVRQKVHVRQQMQVQPSRARSAARQVGHRTADGARPATGLGRRSTDQGQVGQSAAAAVRLLQQPEKAADPDHVQRPAADDRHRPSDDPSPPALDGWRRRRSVDDDSTA